MNLFAPIAVLLALLLYPAPATALDKGAAVEYAIRVFVDPAAGTLEGEARIELPEVQDRWVVDVRGLELESAELDGRPVKPREGLIKARPGSLKLGYSASFGAGSAGADPENPGVVSGGLISVEGVFLQGGWYPEVMDTPRAFFTLKAVLPEGFKAISEAEEITERAVPEGVEFSFLYPYPVAGVTLAAGPYTEYRADAGEVGVYGYFLSDDRELAENYVRRAAEYIIKYTEMFGETPHSRFSVVENVLPTGYSMPTYTLLGSNVMRLPFILDTSLGHEVLHQWFGSGVYSDDALGNWAEGLTSYMADHLYEEEKGEGPGHRKKLVLDYKNYVNRGNEFSLREFRSRTDRASRSIGYGKGAMVFHMLRVEVGEDAFLSTLRRLVSSSWFMYVSWEDIRRFAEDAAGRDLGWFFEQWVGRRGHPDITINAPTYLFINGSHWVRFTLTQKAPAYRFQLPVRVLAEGGGEASVRVAIEKARETVEIESPGLPAELVVDPEYDVLRNFSVRETPPLWSAVMGAERRIVVEPEGEYLETYEPLLKVLEGMGFERRPEAEVSFSDLRDSSAVFTNAASPVLMRLFGRVPPVEDGVGFSLDVMRNPLATRRAVAVVRASDSDEAGLASRKLRHYGRYSSLRFEGGRNTLKETLPSESGIRHRLETRSYFVRTSRTLSLEEVISDIEDRDVIYVGESHASFGDHKLQLAVIQGLVGRGHKVAVGMEMFEPVSNEALGEYVRGETGEKEFLLESKYFESWSMNYNLYREILGYAREAGVPVVGLNQDKATVRKVSISGIGSLSAEELEGIPPEIDLTDEEYRESLEEVFGQHKGSSRFLNFFQAQVLRDEAMARGIAGFMEENPGYKVVVVAGLGHVAYGSGIPKRQKRLNGRDYAILVSGEAGSVDPEMADYVFYTPEPPVPQDPVIGVSLKKEEGGLRVRDLSPGGSALKAGIKEGDLIVEAGGVEVRDVPALKAELFVRSPGGEIRIKVLRKRFILGPKELVLNVRVP
jgi:uncharacterized iron-regulated protein